MPAWPIPGAIDPVSGKHTAPLPSNMTWIGRALDSHHVGSFQSPIRTLKGYSLLPAPELGKLFAIIGSGVAMYDLPTLTQRIRLGKLAPVNSFPNRRGDPELWMSPEAYFYAETSGWQTHNVDTQDRLFGIDYDDRGLVYVAYKEFGWGILDAKSGLVSRYQMVNDATSVAPIRVLAFKVGAEYFVAVSTDSSAHLYSTGTTGAVVVKPVVKLLFAFKEFAKAGNRIATIGRDGGLRVHINTPTGNPAWGPIWPVHGIYTSIDTNGADFFAVSSDGLVTIFGQKGDSFGFTLGRRFTSPPTIRYGAGLLAIFGYDAYIPGTDSIGAANLRLYKAGTLEPVPLQISQTGPAGSTRDFFPNYYQRAGTLYGFATPTGCATDGSGEPPGDARIVTIGGETVLAVSTGGTLDFYGLNLGATTPAEPPQPPVKPPTPPAPPVQPPPLIVPPTVPVAPPEPSTWKYRAIVTKATVAVGEKVTFSVGGMNPQNFGCRWMFSIVGTTTMAGAVSGGSTLSYAFSMPGTYSAVCNVGGALSSPVTVVVTGTATVVPNSGVDRARAART